METFADRLNAALDRVPEIPIGHGRKAWLAERFGVTKAAIGKWFTGGMPELDKLHDVIELTGVRTEWLMFGSGDMTANENEKINHDLLSDLCEFVEKHTPGHSQKKRAQYVAELYEYCLRTGARPTDTTNDSQLSGVLTYLTTK